MSISVFPVRARQVVEHLGRLWILGEDNRIYWSAEQDYGKWYGDLPKDKPILDSDCGYWAIPESPLIYSIKSDGGLIINSTSGVWELTGYDYETFALRKVGDEYIPKEMSEKVLLLKHKVLDFALDVFSNGEKANGTALNIAYGIVHDFIR